MILRAIKLAVLAGAGVAAWKAISRPTPGTFFEQALRSGAGEVEAARSAQLRAASAEIRRFAQQVEHDHNQLNEDLAEASGLEIPEPDARQQAMLHAIDLNQGAAYDRAWLRHMARSHAKAISLYQRAASVPGACAKVASEGLPKLREHARKVEELQLSAAQPGAQSGVQPGAGQAGSAQAGTGEAGAQVGNQGS